MVTTNIKSVVAVVPVKDHQKAVQWYTKLLGSEAHLTPMDDVAEWKLADNAWLQVGFDPEPAGHTTVVLGVTDIDAQRGFCEEAGIPIGDVVEYPEVIKMAEVSDLDGNKVVFVEDVSGQA